MFIHQVYQIKMDNFNQIDPHSDIHEFLKDPLWNFHQFSRDPQVHPDIYEESSAVQSQVHPAIYEESSVVQSQVHPAIYEESSAVQSQVHPAIYEESSVVQSSLQCGSRNGDDSHQSISRVVEIQNRNFPTESSSGGKQITQRIGSTIDQCLGRKTKKPYNLKKLKDLFQHKSLRPKLAQFFLFGNYMSQVQVAKKKKRVKEVLDTNSQRNLLTNFTHLMGGFIQGEYPSNSFLFRQFGSQMSFEKQTSKTSSRR